MVKFVMVLKVVMMRELVIWVRGEMLFMLFSFLSLKML